MFNQCVYNTIIKYHYVSIWLLLTFFECWYLGYYAGCCTVNKVKHDLFSEPHDQLLPTVRWPGETRPRDSHLWEVLQAGEPRGEGLGIRRRRTWRGRTLHWGERVPSVLRGTNNRFLVWSRNDDQLLPYFNT